MNTENRNVNSIGVMVSMVVFEVTLLLNMSHYLAQYEI